MTPLDAALGGSAPRADVAWIMLEKDLKSAKENGKPFTASQNDKIYQLFENYQKFSNVERAKHDRSYPLVTANFKNQKLS